MSNAVAFQLAGYNTTYDLIGERWTLQYVQGTSKKYYRAFFLLDVNTQRYVAIYQWGRVGTMGQFRVYSDKSRLDVLAQLDTKRAKGYTDLSGVEIVDTAMLVPIFANRPEVRDQVLAVLAGAPSPGGEVDEFVDVFGETQALAKATIQQAKGKGSVDSTGQAVVNLSKLKNKMTELETSLEELRGLYDEATTAVRKRLDA